MKQAVLNQKLIPVNIKEELSVCNITEAVNFYKDGLINPDIIVVSMEKEKLSVPTEDRGHR